MDDLASIPVGSVPTYRAPPSRPWWLIRGGRGRVGGTTFLDYAIQRARRQGRRVKPLDADLRSRTLTELYPAAKDGAPASEDVSSPPSESIAAVKAWFEEELNASVEDGMCRAVDFGGGDRVLQEYGQELAIGEFCESFGLGLVWAFVLGPDPEDLRHVVQVIGGGIARGGRILLVLNEGVIRAGQSAEGVFAQTKADADLHRLLDQGATLVTMPRITCLPQLRERGLGFYEASAGASDRVGRRTPPVTQHMARVFLRDLDGALDGSEAAQWLT